MNQNQLYWQVGFQIQGICFGDLVHNSKHSKQKVERKIKSRSIDIKYNSVYTVTVVRSIESGVDINGHLRVRYYFTLDSTGFLYVVSIWTPGSPSCLYINSWRSTIIFTWTPNNPNSSHRAYDLLEDTLGSSGHLRVCLVPVSARGSPLSHKLLTRTMCGTSTCSRSSQICFYSTLKMFPPKSFTKKKEVDMQQQVQRAFRYI